MVNLSIITAVLFGLFIAFILFGISIQSERASTIAAIAAIVVFIILFCCCITIIVLGVRSI